MSDTLNDSSNSSSTFDTVDDLLDYLRISPLSYIIYQLIIPIVGSIGFIFCLINLLIFSRKNYNTAADQYYRLITSLNVFAMLFSIPYGFCFTPKYFPSINSYACALVQCIYIPYTDLIIHFVAVLEISILLERLKILNTFVKKHFRLTPRQMSIISFIGCFLNDAFYAFNYIPVYGGDFFYTDNNGNLKENTFYYLDTSPIALTPIGSSFLIVIYVIKNVFTIITTITLSIVAHMEMRSFLKKRLVRFSLSTLQTNSFQPIDSVRNGSLNLIGNIQRAPPSQYNQERANKNHLFMIIVLCVITILERLLSIICDVYFLFSVDEIAFTLAALVDLVYVLGPALSFFVFYNFNSNFKKDYSAAISYLHKKFRDIYID